MSFSAGLLIVNIMQGRDEFCCAAITCSGAARGRRKVLREVLGLVDAAVPAVLVREDDLFLCGPFLQEPGQRDIWKGPRGVGFITTSMHSLVKVE